MIIERGHRTQSIRRSPRGYAPGAFTHPLDRFQCRQYYDRFYDVRRRRPAHRQCQDRALAVHVRDTITGPDRTSEAGQGAPNLNGPAAGSDPKHGHSLHELGTATKPRIDAMPTYCHQPESEASTAPESRDHDDDVSRPSRHDSAGIEAVSEPARTGKTDTDSASRTRRIRVPERHERPAETSQARPIKTSGRRHDNNDLMTPTSARPTGSEQDAGATAMMTAEA